MTKTAVVLFNLGGPDSPEAVRPFLFNLFNDPAIIGAPWPLRWAIAKLISTRRAPVARAIYAELGGRSPLRELTEAQAAALQDRLADADRLRVFVAMRYWHPLSDATAEAVRAWGPDRIVLLPLYPQFSTSTSASSFAAWRGAAKAVGLEAPTRSICCYPTLPAIVAAQAALIARALDEAEQAGRPRLLFSAHGLPKRTIARGDPYQWQVEQTAAAIAAALEAERGTGLDWRVCYQSRVGPLEWIGPYTDAEVIQAGRDGAPLVVVPIAFVSEHSETLVELDIEYRALAEGNGVPAYRRVPALGTTEAFIDGLAMLVRQACAWPAGAVCSQAGGRLCPAGFARCAAATGV